MVVHPVGMAVPSKPSVSTGTCALTPNVNIAINNVKNNKVFFILLKFGE
jgi:hypothetical protein